MTEDGLCRASRLRASMVTACLALIVCGAALAQQTGNVYGTASDEDGVPLPGVTVTLEGVGAPRVMHTDESARYRFLGLDPGAYHLRAVLDGFTTIEQPNVVVALNRSTTIHFILTGAVEDLIVVTSESPLLDERKYTTGTTVSQIELEKIPTARDPWALLSQAPGVAVDSINVAGADSWNQPLFRAPGVSSTENDYVVDGVQINDMWVVGFSPTYFDFDQFVEIGITTGGADVTKNTAGVALNMVTKRGSNAFRGSARFYVTDAEGYFGGALKQSQPDFESELCRTGCPTEQTSLEGARVNNLQDLGFEAGGAVVQDRLWLWGSWSQNLINNFAASGDADDTVLDNTSIKLNAQLSASNSGLASYNNGDVVRNGRGAGPGRSPESLWDQRGPTAIYRFEDTHVFSSSFFVTGTYSLMDAGYELLARGPSDVENGLSPDAPDPSYDANGVWQENFLSGRAVQPNDEFKVDASYFFNTGSNTSHELKVGGRLRRFEGTNLFSWGPRNVFHTFWGTTVARHSQQGPTTTEYRSLWAQDTITVGNATISAGLRYDDQSGEGDAVSLPAHAVFPEILPAIDVAGGSHFSTDSLVPRLGLTYAMGGDRDTLLRASFSKFAAQLAAGQGNWTSPTYYAWYAYFYGGELYAALHFDPLNPSVSPNTYGKRWDESTSELLAVVEHAFLPELVVGGTVTWRSTTNIIDWIPNVRDGSGSVRTATVDDFEQVATLTGTVPRSDQTYSQPVFDFICGDLFDPTEGCPSGGGTLGSGPREREYLGFYLTFTKRLANRWMARGFLNYGDAEWSVPEDYVGCINNYRGGGCHDGDLYVERSPGAGKGERFVQATWSFNLNGMVQVAPDRRWGFNLSTNIAGHAGHPIPYYDRILPLSIGVPQLNILDDLGRYRLHDPITMDLRVEKEFAVSGPMSLTFGVDLFNALNDNTGLSYNTNAGTNTGGWLQDHISPRVWRLGVRLNWK